MFKKFKIILALIALGIVVALCVILPVVFVDDKPEDEGTNNPLEFQSLKFTILDEEERTVNHAAEAIVLHRKRKRDKRLSEHPKKV